MRNAQLGVTVSAQRSALDDRKRHRDGRIPQDKPQHPPRGSFFAFDVPLSPGANELHVVAATQGGRELGADFTVVSTSAQVPVTVYPAP